jgi:transcriptional regulator of heat shock response
LDHELATEAAHERLEEFLDHVSVLLASLSQEIGMTLMPSGDTEASEKPARRKLSLQGLPYILEKPEFQDVKKVRNLLGFFEEKTTLPQWVLTHADTGQVSGAVGREHAHEALEDCAIVTARYGVGESRKGVIAILGPKRMAYRQIIPLVSRVAAVVGDILEHKEPEVL